MGLFFFILNYTRYNNRVFPNKGNFLPRNYEIFTFSEYSKEEKSAKYYKSYNASGFCIHNYIIYVTNSGSVHSAYNFLVSYVIQSASHVITPIKNICLLLQLYSLTFTYKFVIIKDRKQIFFLEMNI